MQLVQLALIIGAVCALDAPALTYETFRTEAIPLRSGQIINSAAYNSPHIPWIKGGNHVIRSFTSTIVDATGVEVPQTELYVHHWLIFDVSGPNGGCILNGGFCPNLQNVFGIGAELRGNAYIFPYPYGVVMTGREQWGANLHFIRTTNAPDVQMCIECHCPDGTPSSPKGGVRCCPDGGQCYGMENSTLQDTKNYFLQYTIGYAPVDNSTLPLTVFTLDVTSTVSVDCQTEYQVPQLAPGEFNVVQTFVNITFDMDVVFVENHQHIGGYNMTLEHFRNGETQGILCTSVPTYGNGTIPGNENGYVVAIPTCTYPSGFALGAGDQILMTSIYTARTLPGSTHTWHEGVMGLTFMFAHATIPPVALCTKEFNTDCGPPPYFTTDICMQCAQYFAADLTASMCTSALIGSFCNQTAGVGRIPTPSTVPAMTAFAYPVNYTSNTYFFNITGPRGAWFAFGYNPTVPQMDSAYAAVYANDASGNPALQLRKLGNHAPGSVLAASIPGAVVTESAAGVNFQFEIALPGAAVASLAASRVADQPMMCYLFATGTSMVLDYHGSTRGTWCQF